MASARLKSTVSACAVALACGALFPACGPEPGIVEPAREGLAIEVGGINYDVFLTRQLNLAITPDKAFYQGPPAEPGSTYYGVFLQACNLSSDENVTSTNDFVVEDNQGNEFEPLELPDENPFAYQPTDLGKDDCIPEDGSVAQQGPTAGALLIFKFPIETTGHRPLNLTITPPPGGGESKQVELDL